MNCVSYTVYYKDMEILDAKIQDLDAKLDKALRIMVKILKEIKQNDERKLSANG